MRNPEGKIGTVIQDENPGEFRYLTVGFEDGTQEVLQLSNVGRNPTKSQKWAWLFEREGKKEWCEWGVM